MHYRRSDAPKVTHGSYYVTQYHLLFSAYFFCIANNIDKGGGGGGGATVWEIIGKLITPQEGEVSSLILQLLVPFSKAQNQLVNISFQSLRFSYS